MAISTHTLTWSVTKFVDKDFFYNGFQLTRSRGAWPCNHSKFLLHLEYFNSHAHVERDAQTVSCQIAAKISTHTLTWSVTPLSSWLLALFGISTHTLTWSVTKQCLMLILSAPISTHTLTWSVTVPNLGLTNAQNISTHTLTWSVTKAGMELIVALANFNSHAHVERDFQLPQNCPRQWISTHTLTWSVTLIEHTFYKS